MLVARGGECERSNEGDRGDRGKCEDLPGRFLLNGSEGAAGARRGWEEGKSWEGHGGEVIGYTLGSSARSNGGDGIVLSVGPVISCLRI